MRTPIKFVSLHNHDGYSAFDGLGAPEEHFNSCLDNGIIAHAITNHGHMNSYAAAQLWVEKHNKEHTNQAFKFIPGVEVYFHPDLKQWERDKASADQARIDKKEAKKLQSKQEQLQTKLLTVTDANDETVDIEMSNALTVENEDESKSTKHFNPVNRRHHLVLLPKNDRGLQKLFGLVSHGYLHGFYRFPRIDTGVLREACKDGDIIASSACVAGHPSWEIFQVLQQYKFDELDQRLLDDPVMLERCVAAVGNAYDLMTSAVGKENYYLELQFNRLPAQNLVNRAIIEFARRNGVTQQLTVTCDAHYARKELWLEREIYRKLGFMNYTDYSPDSLPKSVDDLKCELYPKNAGQVWDEYLRSKEGTTFYDDALICDTIERTHDIAFNIIGTVKPDRSTKYPKGLVPADKMPIQHLTKMCMQGLIDRGLADKPEYIERLKEELGVIKTKQFAEYFITYAKIMELAHAVVMCGVGRGSGGGSLVNYVLRITDLDPIRWDLPFARFLTIYRCLSPTTRVLCDAETSIALEDVCVGDKIQAQDGTQQTVTRVERTKHKKLYKINVNGSTLTCSGNHRWFVAGANGEPIEKLTSELTTADVVYTYYHDVS